MHASKELDKGRKTPEQNVASSTTGGGNISSKEQVQLTEQVRLLMTSSQVRGAANLAESSAEWQKPEGKQQ